MEIKEHPIETLNIKDIKSIAFNRTINMNHVDKLLNSMYNFGIIRQPIVVRGKLNTNKVSYWSLDGQHLLAGLYKKDKRTVKCVVITTEDIPMIVNLMAVVNNSSLKWVLDNYVNAYAALCSKEYEKLRAHKLATGLNYAVSAMLLSESCSCNTIKDGSFKASAKDVDVVTADLIDVISFLGTNNSKFMKAFIKFRRSPNVEYNHKRFMQRLAQNKSEVKLVHDEAAMKEILINLYK
jgi:hypothetical protein